MNGHFLFLPKSETYVCQPVSPNVSRKTPKLTFSNSKHRPSRTLHPNLNLQPRTRIPPPPLPRILEDQQEPTNLPSPSLSLSLQNLLRILALPPLFILPILHNSPMGKHDSIRTHTFKINILDGQCIRMGC